MESSRKKKTLNSKWYIRGRQRTSCHGGEQKFQEEHICEVVHSDCLMKARRAVCAVRPTLYDSMDHSPAGSSVHGSLQGRILK